MFLVVAEAQMQKNAHNESSNVTHPVHKKEASGRPGTLTTAPPTAKPPLVLDKTVTLQTLTNIQKQVKDANTLLQTVDASLTLLHEILDKSVWQQESEPQRPTGYIS
jgi:hypothetical protein